MLSSRVLAILRNFMTWILIVFLLKENWEKSIMWDTVQSKREYENRQLEWLAAMIDHINAAIREYERRSPRTDQQRGESPTEDFLVVRISIQDGGVVIGREMKRKISEIPASMQLRADCWSRRVPFRESPKFNAHTCDHTQRTRYAGKCYSTIWTPPSSLFGNTTPCNSDIPCNSISFLGGEQRLSARKAAAVNDHRRTFRGVWSRNWPFEKYDNIGTIVSSEELGPIRPASIEDGILV
jgi:hypothetical protein